ncbi:MULTISPECIES: CPBP family intramembrane glutamic endopeptidase [unclassified Microbacterium]|uniref:CPBP family intramembrane glutamic endopeptidase n=1 Tax=unclassified Microbacterium TaxID=2609290 RepID=UPI003015E71E
MTTEPSPTERVGRRSWAGALLVMVAWWGTTYGFGSVPIPALQPGWFPQLGVVVTNGLSLAVAWGVAALVHRAGWWGSLPLRRIAGWGGGRIDALWWLAPVLAVQLSYIWIGRQGVPGIAGSAGTLLSVAAGMLAVGISEETASRGLALGAVARRPWLGVAVTSLVFGLWHLGNGLFFGRSVDETWWQVLGAATFGVCFAGARLLIGSIWPLAFLHALGDWTQVLSPGAAPVWYQIAVMVFELVWGVALTAVAVRRGLHRSP